jgi:mannonate dehydratase
MIHIAEILLEPAPDPFWKALQQVGVTHAVGILPRRPFDWRGTSWEPPWGYGPMALYKEQIEETGLDLSVIEDNPPMDRIRLGRIGRDEEIEQFTTLIRNMGRLGIPVLCYNWMAVLGWLRTSTATAGRAGAQVSAFDRARLRDAPHTSAGTVTEDQLWDSLRYFLDRVVPVAEEAGVKLAMHPDDPPVSPIRGITRIMRSPEAFERLVEMVPSDANGITFCQANFSLMTDDVPAVIRRFGDHGKIFFVHFRDVRGRPSGSLRHSMRTARRTWWRACAPTETSASTGCCGPTMSRHWKATQRRFPATRGPPGCKQSGTSPDCGKRSTKDENIRRRLPHRRTECPSS